MNTYQSKIDDLYYKKRASMARSLSQFSGILAGFVFASITIILSLSKVITFDISLQISPLALVSLLMATFVLILATGRENGLSCCIIFNLGLYIFAIGLVEIFYSLAWMFYEARIFRGASSGIIFPILIFSTVAIVSTLHLFVATYHNETIALKRTFWSIAIIMVVAFLPLLSVGAIFYFVLPLFDMDGQNFSVIAIGVLTLTVVTLIPIFAGFIIRMDYKISDEDDIIKFYPSWIPAFLLANNFLIIWFCVFPFILVDHS